MSDAEDLSPDTTTRSINLAVHFTADTLLDREAYIRIVRSRFAQVVADFTGQGVEESDRNMSLNYCDVVPKTYHVTITIRATGPSLHAVRQATRNGISGLSWCNDVFSYTDQQIVGIEEVPRPGDLPTGGLMDHIRAIVGDPVPAGGIVGEEPHSAFDLSREDDDDDDDDDDDEDEDEDEDEANGWQRDDLALAGSVHDAEHDDPNRDQPF